MAKKTKCELEAAAQAIVAQFDSLPDDAHVRVRVVAKLKSCSVATVWRGVKSGRITAPRELTPGVKAWRVGDLRQAPRRAA